MGKKVLVVGGNGFGRHHVGLLTGAYGTRDIFSDVDEVFLSRTDEPSAIAQARALSDGDLEVEVNGVKIDSPEDLARLVTEYRFDLVSIATPSDTHLAYAYAALRSGEGMVLLEKPAAPAIGDNSSYNAIEELREFDGRIGLELPFAVVSDVIENQECENSLASHMRGGSVHIYWRTGGNDRDILSNLGPHPLSLALPLLGDDRDMIRYKVTPMRKEGNVLEGKLELYFKYGGPTPFRTISISLSYGDPLMGIEIDRSGCCEGGNYFIQIDGNNNRIFSIGNTPLSEFQPGSGDTPILEVVNPLATVLRDALDKRPVTGFKEMLFIQQQLEYLAGYKPNSD
jgi:predicted dehydrogenase